MFNIVALGKTAQEISVEFVKLADYEVLAISESMDSSSDNICCHHIKSQSNPEDYERPLTAKLKKLLSNVSDEFLFIVDGSEYISSASLVILENLHKKKKSINILYIKPELEFLPYKNKVSEKVIRNILQEYTRSGLFASMCLIDFTQVESLIESTTILSRNSDVFSRVAYCYHMIEGYKNSEPVSSTIHSLVETSRIKTIGYSTLTRSPRKMFFDLKLPREIVYYFAVNSKKLSVDQGLFKKITDSIDRESEPLSRHMFGIYGTDFEEDFMFYEYYTPHVQNEELTKILVDKKQEK